MKNLCILLLLVLFSGCTKENKTIELLSYSVSPVYRENNDTIFSQVIYRIYASVDDDGTCLLQLKNYDTPPRYCKIQLQPSMVDKIFALCDSVNKDTVMIRKSNPGSYLYCGTSIDLIKKDASGKAVFLRFIHSNRSNSTCYSFYNYINSIAEKITRSNIADTSLLAAKTRNCSEVVYNKIKPDIPICIKSDVQFTTPVIKSK